MKKNIALVLAFIITILCFTSCSKKNKNEDGTESTTANKIVIETVTGENGEVVTDESGETVTEKYEEVPVLDDKGKPVLDEKGEVVTQKVLVEKKQDTPSAAGTTSKNENTTSSTTNPIEPPVTQPKPTNPSITQPKPTDPPATHPSPTEPPVTQPKPIEPPTTKPAPISYEIDYFVEYAKSYGQSIGLNLLTGITPNNGSWDMPLTGKFPITEQWKVDYKLNEIQERCKAIQREDNADFWVYAEKQSNGSYYLYIGY